MRDNTKLRAFRIADDLAMIVYRVTRCFPREELFGLTAQIRRSAVSVPSNIVEGCARSGQADYLHFLNIAFGSLRELAYQLSLANRLGYLTEDAYRAKDFHCVEASKVLAALIRALRNPMKKPGPNTQT